jgi:uncharacterized membrane protein
MGAYFIIFLILGILLLPFLVVFLIFNFFTAGLTQLGFTTSAGFLIVFLMFLSSSVNIPLEKKETIVLEGRRLFGSLNSKRKVRRGVSINLGGAIIPLFIVAGLFSSAPVQATFLATLIVTLTSYKTAKIIPGFGVVMPVFLPLGATLLSALLLAPQNPEVVAFISGVLGTIIGADLLHLPQIMNKSNRMMVIGGAGVFDGIFLIGIIASILAGF